MILIYGYGHLQQVTTPWDCASKGKGGQEDKVNIGRMTLRSIQALRDEAGWLSRYSDELCAGRPGLDSR